MAEANQAPALVRGIALLRLLQAGKPQHLEELAGTISLAKSSTLRLLDTLAECDLIRRDPQTKAYRAVVRLVPIVEEGVALEQSVREELDSLSAATGQTAEWWEPHSGGMVLYQRSAPRDRGVLVHAKLNHVYQDTRLEAIPLLGSVFFSVEAESGKRLFSWNSDGSKAYATKKAVAAVRQEAEQGWWIDAVPNAMGVRRVAWVVRDGNGPIGVVAIAVPAWPWIEDLEREYGEQVSASARRLTILGGGAQ